MAVFTETELILPTLYLLDQSGGQLSTSKLINDLTIKLEPTGKDAILIAGRNDTHFSQKVRNLVSHRTLDKLNFADYNPNLRGLVLTEKGKQHLEANKSTMAYVMESNFEWEDLTKALEVLAIPDRKIEHFEEVFEGSYNTVETKVYKRSKKLRDAAIDSFKNQYGALICDICSFDYEVKYGNIGKGFIEVHHRKPIFMYEGSDEAKTIHEAIKNLAPLCANCHRMIHRKKPPYSIDNIKSIYITK